MMSSFKARMGPLSGSTSDIAWKMRGKACPNCIDSMAIFMSVVLLTLGVPSWDFRMVKDDVRSVMRLGDSVIRERLSFSLNIRTAFDAGSRILNPS